MSAIDDGVSVNPSDNEHFEQVLVKRRTVLGSAAGVTLAGLLSGGVATVVGACAPQPPAGGSTLLGFTGIPTSTADPSSCPTATPPEC